MRGKLMKKIFLVTSLLVSSTLFGNMFAAEASLNRLLPLLQKNHRSAAENQQVLQIFRSATDPDVIFAAGASLVKTPPPPAQEPALFTTLLRTQDPLKQTFSAVIITAMGSVHGELTPVLEQALLGKDPVLRAYAAAAYSIINPQDTYTQEIIRLYIFDPAFATRALNVSAGKTKTPVKYLKQAAASQDGQIRAAAATWLATLHTPQAATQLLKMAKKETSAEVQSAIARGLALQREHTFSSVTAALRKKYNSPYAATCALALGFMTGNAVEPLRQALSSNHRQAHINAARAAAYMAGVLSNPDAFSFSSDRAFDTHLLKGLIAPLNVLAKNGDETEKLYAQTALTQIEKLME